jgi:hypothetical protein
MSVTPINEQRERRAGDLRDRAEGAQDRARALHGLVEMIRNTPAPVQRWQPVWDNITEQLEREADKFVGVSKSCLEHVEIMERSVEAHDKWIPKRADRASE